MKVLVSLESYFVTKRKLITLFRIYFQTYFSELMFLITSINISFAGTS